MAKRLSHRVTPFNDFYYKSCLHMPCLSAVRHFGGDVRVFLANDLFVYAHDDGSDLFSLTLHFYETSSEVRVLENAGVDSVPLLVSDGLIATVKSALEGGLVLVPVDRFSYHTKYNTLHRREHYAHHVLVCGFDDTTETFEVIDAPETPIEGLNTFADVISYQVLENAYSSYLEFCDGSGSCLRLSARLHGYAERHCGEAAARAFAETVRTSQPRVQASLAELRRQAEKIQAADRDDVAGESLELILRRLFPIDRSKDADYQRIRLLLSSPHEQLRSQVLGLGSRWKEYKMALGKCLLQRKFEVEHRRGLVALLDQIYQAELRYGQSLIEAVGSC
jgi:hypothetical protein